MISTTYPVPVPRLPAFYCPSKREEAFARFTEESGRAVIVALTGAGEHRQKEAFALPREDNPRVH